MKQYRPHFLVACVLMTLLLTGVPHSLQNSLTDTRFKWFPREASGTLALVAIDSPSIERLGIWPWPRKFHADLIGQLQKAGASEIVFDVDFSSPSNPEADQAFARSLREAGGSVVLPAFKQRVTDGGAQSIHLTQPLAEFNAQSWTALVNVAVEPDGLVRRYSLGEALDGSYTPSIGALLAGNATGAGDLLRIDFSIRPDSLPTVSYADVLRGDPAALQKLKGKKVVVGATAIELGDRFSVPNGNVISGPQLQMLAAESILQDRALRSTSGFITLAGLLVIALMMAWLWQRNSAGVRTVVLLALAASAELTAILLQSRFAIILDTALWHLACAAYLIVMALDEIDLQSLLSGVAEKRFRRIANSLGDGLVCVDQHGVITFGNSGAQAIFGCDDRHLIGRTIDTILTVRDQAGRPTLFSCAIEQAEIPFGTLREIEGRRSNGEIFPLEISLSRWEGVSGFQYGAVMRDISDRKREEARIQYLADHDTLTGLANRHALYEHLHVALSAAKAGGRKVALLLLDLDKFKQVNDALGHACGDQLLCSVATRLDDLDGDGFVARLSGDEFAIVIEGEDVIGRAERHALKITQAFRRTPFCIDDRQIRINVSIGVALYPDFGKTADELFGNADLALYRAKAIGRGKHIIFERNIRDEIETRIAMEAALTNALAKEELELFYQPQIHLKDGSLAGVEALIRWRHPRRGLMSPAEFMPVVKSSALSNQFALWVMENACRQGKRWEAQGHPVRIGVNLSPSQLQSGNLAATVATVLHNTGFAPDLLELEVTEDIVLEDDEIARDTFRQIQDLGVRVAFDDFGTGYASLTYLKKFSLDGLKIDQSFVRELRPDSGDAAIVSCAISLGKLLGMRVIAEGVESAATAGLLQQMGCEEGQGYHFGPPMPAAEFEQKFLHTDPSRGIGPSAANPAADAA